MTWRSWADAQGDALPGQVEPGADLLAADADAPSGANRALHFHNGVGGQRPGRQRGGGRGPGGPATSGAQPGIIPVEATQRPSADIIPTSLRDLFGYRWAFRCSTEASSDTILGHGWANQGYSATEIDPQARGVSWLRAEDGIPRRVKAAYLTDAQIIELAAWAAQARATHGPGDQADGHADGHADGGAEVIQLHGEGDAA